MTQTERVELLFGPYPTPKVRVGAVLSCELRDADVIVVEISAARIPWPVCRRKIGGRGRGHALCGPLVEAVRRESAQAVAYWWGVTGQTVTKWRKALGVGATTEGTSKIRSRYAFEPWAVAAREKANSKAGDPDRCAKIATAKRGKRRPSHVIEAMCKSRKGKRHDAEARRKMSDAHRRRGTRPPKAGRPWLAAEDLLVRTLAAAEAAEKTGRKLAAVYGRRSQLKVPDGRAATTRAHAAFTD